MARRQQGMVFGLVILFHGIGRFLEEAIVGTTKRTDTWAVWPLALSQVVSVPTFVLACICLIILYRLPAAPPTAVRIVPS